MSVTISTDLFCDTCCQWDSDVTQTGPQPYIRKARREAKHKGWKFDGQSDMCPDCAGKARTTGERP